MSRREFLDEQGYITLALGEKYLQLAYAQALSIKSTQRIKNYAVIVDSENAKNIDKYSHVFDKVIVLDYQPSDWDMTQHWKVFHFTPWRETVLLDADILFTSSVDHWWDAMRLRDICFTTDVYDFREDVIKSRHCRKLFDENLLPNVYGGFVYFRYSELATEFFSVVRAITMNWEWIATNHLIKNEDLRVRIDEVFAIAVRIVGIQHTSLPANIPTFVHAKESLWGLGDQLPWHEQLFVEFGKDLLVGHFKQRLPFHYHHKEWITDDIIRRLERNYQESLDSVKEY